MKAKKRYPLRKNKKRLLKYGVVATSVLVLSILLFTILSPESSPYYPNPEAFYFNVAIVDQLSLTAPNQTFVQTAATILQDGGFTVDYYLGQKVTVEFFKNLPTHKYGIIILRVHSAKGLEGQPSLTLFTSEPLSNTKYVAEMLNDQLQGVAYKPGDPAYFGIPPKFISTCLNGGFENTVIIAMGCNGLTSTDMARAFIDKGAKIYLGWSDSVTSTQTDNAVQQLLQKLVIERKQVWLALASTHYDQNTGTRLKYYPYAESNYILPQKSPQNNQTAQTTGIYTNDAFFTKPQIILQNRNLFPSIPPALHQESHE